MPSKSEHVPQLQSAPRTVSVCGTCTRAGAVTAVIVGLLGLLRWEVNNPAYKNVLPGLKPMGPGVSLALALLGLVLWLRQNPHASVQVRRIAAACASMVILAGLIALVRSATHRDFGAIEHVYLASAVLPGTLLPGVMTPATAGLFITIGAAMLFLDVESTTRRPAQILLLFVGLYTLAVLIGYIFFSLSAQKPSPHYLAVLPTALTFVLLSLGGMCARPDRGVMRLLTAEAIGSDVTRRLLPAAIVGPPLLCVVSYLGFRVGAYDVPLGLAVLTTLNSAVLTTVIWRTGAALNQTDAERRHSELQRTELNSELEQAHAFREKVLDTAVFAVVALDMERRFTLVNRRMLDMTGYSAESLVGQPFTILSPLESRDLVDEQLLHILHERVPMHHAETQLARNDGSLLTIAFGWSPLFSEGEVVGLVGTGEDITERKRLEEQLFQSRKLESLGRIASYVAHDFNNMLTVFNGYSELIDLEIPTDSSLTHHVHGIRNTVLRASKLTSQLLAFARRQLTQPRVINLNELVVNTDDMLQRLIGEHIKLSAKIASDLRAVRVDPNQFEQILINLVVNARDAIPAEGGRIIIETGNVSLDGNYARQHEDVEAGDYVMLAVSDTGCGMDESVRLQIFEPFFSTKEQGRGTGLGLASVYGAVKQAGGHIWIYSEIGKGTTFKIYLPQVSEHAEPIFVPDSPIASPRGTETLLIAEDEAELRMLATTALKTLGYRVIEAADGAAALEIASGLEEKIDLLITDVVMPHMSGKDLAEELRASRPSLKVLYVSGYTEDTLLHHGATDPGIAFLAKPYTLSGLSHKVREVLGPSTVPDGISSPPISIS